jgi:cytochrome c553
MLRLLSLILLGLTMSAGVRAADLEAGKAKSTICSACHGQNGISANPLWPNLAGQKDQYLIAQLKAYRDGSRKNPLMSPMATGLSDADIENLAAYYGSLNCQ